MIAINRLSRCPRTRAYVHKRSSDGKADLDLFRRLKRYIAREVYELLVVTFEHEERVVEAA
jgi:transposase